MVRTLLSPRPLDAGVSKQVLLYSRCISSHASFLHMFQSLLIVCMQENFQVLQTLTFAWNNSTGAFAMESSASQHSDVTVRLFESDTRVIERARLRVHSTWVSGNSTRHHADFTPVVTLSVTVALVSKFLLRCPGKSDFRSRHSSETGHRASWWKR